MSDMTMDQKKSAFLMAWRVAQADGHLDDSEAAILAALSIRFELTESDLDDALANPRIAVPDTLQERLFVLETLVSVMMIDGGIDEREMLGCSLIAKLFGFKVEIIPELVRSIIERISSNQSCDDLAGKYC